jgi:phage tail-like protein
MAQPGEDKLIYPLQHFRLDLAGGETIGLFTSATVPGVNITAPDWKAENEQKKPQNYHAGVQVTFSDLQLTRGIDAERQLWDWVQQIIDTGVTPDTKKDIKLILVDSQGADVITWNITGAYPTSYQASGVNAQTAEIGTEQISLHCDTLTRE